MELKQLEYFMRIAKCGSITSAAEELHISQPSLSSSLHRLEKELGTPLFQRSGRGIVLNDYGRFVLENTRKMFELIKVMKVADGAGETGGRLSVGLHNYNETILKLIDTFMEKNPEVVVDVYGGTMSEPFPTYAYDFIVAPKVSKFQATMDSILLEKRSYYVILPKHHALASAERLCMQDLKNEKFCFIRNSRGDFEDIYYLCTDAGFRPSIMYITNHAFYKLRYVSKGTCAAFIPSTWYEQYRKCENIVLIPLDGVNAEDEVRVYWDRETAVSPAAVRFLNFVIESTAAEILNK